MGVVADYENIPAWFLYEDEEQEKLALLHEATIDGDRWISNAHVMFAVTGEAKHQFAPMAKYHERPEVVAASEPKTPQAPIVRASALYADTGSQLGHYAVPFEPGNIELALSYYGLIVHLFGRVEWFGSGTHAPMVAKVGGKIVAVVMPAPTASAAKAGARHEATAEARGE